MNKFTTTLSLAIFCFLGMESARAADEPTNISPTPGAPAGSSLKINYVLPTAQIEKLVAAGMPEDVVKAYAENFPYPFNLTPDAIIHLKSIGVSGAVLTSMLNHDKALRETATATTPPQSYPPFQSTGQPQTPPSAPESTVDYGTGTPSYAPQYYNDLAGYGNWSYDGGYGWGWQPYAGLGYAYYPWGLLGSGGWRLWPNRGWCWSPNSRFRTFGGRDRFANFRSGAGFNRSFTGNRTFSGFHGGFGPSVMRSGGGGSHFNGDQQGGFGGGNGGAHAGGFGANGHR